MAIMAHWIEAKSVPTAEGLHYILKLRSELIAFHHLEGRHSGSHLADTFIQILEKYKVAKKVSYDILQLFDINIKFISCYRLGGSRSTMHQITTL